MQKNADLSAIYDLLGISGQKTLKDLFDEKKKLLFISSDRQLSSLIGINKDTMSRIINGDSKKVDLISIIKISNFLDLNIEDTVKVYVSSLEPEYISEIEDNRKANYIVRNFDLEGLKKMGFIKSKTDFKLIEKRIISYFKIPSIFDYTTYVAQPLFSKGKRSGSDLMNDFWVKSAYNNLQAINNPNEFDFNDFKKLIPKIRPYTRLEKNGLLTVIRALYIVGVSVIVQKHVTKTSVKGATFIVNNKPCIVLTDYYNRYDMLWFTLFHELCHIMYDLEDLRTNKYHLTGHPDLLLLNEDRANHFARTMLFADEKMDFIFPNIKTHLVVSKYAKDNNVHPSIIYGFYLHDNPSKRKTHYPILNKYLISSEVAYKSIKLNTWTSEDPSEEIKKVLETISN
ncbi:plasmid maintenance system antidote protein [Psychroflexus torquis ATCC 700755]|uniref:Plasmid maintenance system antidote protein n=1 Tax=Psychroflexus torquis (strain ATCC 700755 / CIP 106069 / ACAM 623) TaxID=313595 RepID=K4IFJ7_PSYTT|nr:helix-turn-helix transcriptional regulator [Psychroflexus torquis]AFU68578.1 plasmid maintenance system antidote protein [Psychroflexus torquis ATCC 700755]